jgi:hypothetical protein
VRDVASALLFNEAGDRTHQVVLGEDFVVRATHFHEDCGTLVAEDMGPALEVAWRGVTEPRDSLRRSPS